MVGGATAQREVLTMHDGWRRMGRPGSEVPKLVAEIGKKKKRGNGIVFGCGSCGKTRLKKRTTFEKKRSGCEKIITCVGVFYEVLIVVELGNVVREGPKEG